MITSACEDRDFPDWHGGCRDALVWAADVNTAPIRSNVATARRLLRDVLLPRYERQPHITIAFAGLRPEPGCNPTGQLYSVTDLNADLERLALRTLRPFSVTVGAWASFETAPYLQVTGPGLELPHQVLTTDRPHGIDYTPHVTIGHYAISAPWTQIQQRLSGWAPDSIQLEIEALTLFSYRTNDISGPLTRHGSYCLERNEWVPKQQH